LGITLAHGTTAHLQGGGADLILSIELNKRGESTWNRIKVVDRLARRVSRSSAYSVGHPELLAARALPPLYVNDTALDLGNCLHEGDTVT
jgi:hypothetical protein